MLAHAVSITRARAKATGRTGCCGLTDFPLLDVMCTMSIVTSYRARVRKGRLVLDIPTDLPEGSEVDLVPVIGIESDLPDLDDDERRRLDAALQRALAEDEAGRHHDLDDVLRELKRG
jgi:hypothetical protein